MLSQADFPEECSQIPIHTEVGSCLIAEDTLQCLPLLSDSPPKPKYLVYENTCHVQ